VKTRGLIGLAVFTAVLLGGFHQGAVASAAPVSIAEGRYTFQQLGWESDRSLATSADTASLAFELPQGIVQGDPMWYGLRLVWEWKGTPPSGTTAYFYARWNGKAVYQLKNTRRDWFTADGSEWSMVDFVQGASVAFEITDSVAGSSSNLATRPAVGTGGPTVVGFQLDTARVPDGAFGLTISNQSEIFATRWQPPHFEAAATARVDRGDLVVELRGRNTGWQTPSSFLAADVTIDGGTNRVAGPDRGPIPALGDIHLTERFPVSGVPERVVVVLSWGDGLGSQPFAVAPPRDRSWAISPLIVGGYWTGLGAFVVAWVAFSTAFRRGAPATGHLPRVHRGRRPLVAGALSLLLVGAALALLAVVQRPEAATAGYGPYPFPTGRELPLLDDVNRAKAKQLIDADPRIITAAAGQTWTYPEMTVATSHGAPIGVHVILLFERGISGQGPWLWLACHGSQALEAPGPAVNVPGIEVVVSTTGKGILEMVPLSGTPAGQHVDVPHPQSACSG
jgi:hypothetical protein